MGSRFWRLTRDVKLKRRTGDGVAIKKRGRKSGSLGQEKEVDQPNVLKI